MLPWVVARIGHPVYDRLRFGGRIGRALGELERTDRMSRAELDALGERRLAALLDHAARHVPFYREAFAGAGVAAPGSMFDHSSFTRLRLLANRGTWDGIDPILEAA